MSISSYTRADVVRWFGTREVEKATPYLKVVKKLSVLPHRITAQVQGTVKTPYRVTIDLIQERGVVSDVQARCTCPVGWHCKHCAAVLIAALSAKQKPDEVNREVLAWLEDFRKALEPPAPKPTKRTKRHQVLIYALRMPGFGCDAWHVTFIKAQMTAEGAITPPIEEWQPAERSLLQPPRFVDAEDLDILRLLWMQKNHGAYGEHIIAGSNGGELMRRMLASGRLVFVDEDHERLIPLAQEEARPGSFKWRHDAIGRLVPAVETAPTGDAVVNAGELWYLDLARGVAGPVELAGSAEHVARLLTIPPLSAPDLPVVSAVLSNLAPDIPKPETASGELQVVEAAPVPVLRVGTLSIHGARFRKYGFRDRQFDFAHPLFRYGDYEVSAEESTEFIISREGRTVRVVRQPEQEAQWLKALTKTGLARVPSRALHTPVKIPQPFYGLESEDRWPEFMLHRLPALRDDGWEVQIPDDFRHQVIAVESWEAEVREEDGGWFTLDMGIVVEGRRMPLAPLLYDLFQREPHWLDAAIIDRVDDEASVFLLTPEGKRVAIPSGRLKPLVRTLIDLFDAPVKGELRLSRLDALRLDALAAQRHLMFKGAEDVQLLAQRLEAGRGIASVPTPDGFGLELRAYQREGLGWLQFLREQELGGILADDMGLGKTAQTIAHLLVEKMAGRLDRPALVVFPTSLLFNWRREVERCAPSLRVLTLHGPERKEQFFQIPSHDVVLTTYPLLWRDTEELAAFEYHLIILDEAQAVKNVASKAAQAARQLTTRHRLCLTGTPLENHLGELWAQFDFLLPGFLGDLKRFTRSYRTPIEKNGDTLRRDLLARRIRPFILRRTKEEVAKELPPKSIIVRTVELEGGQRDLYETVRSAMDSKVREAIALQGFARSQIVILDALLKLRQVCCDPRLLKTTAAGRVKERAKLDLLMEMIPELVEEGRRILIFSQFTSMLELIAAQLERAKLPFVILTGQSRQREQVIKRFQEGTVPLFLISLKAGGVGLNLTAADTVIHYDPWWNPAAENQATDRAHRIGQTKPVFVYKLIVAGSIEEKILALQEKKGDLAAGVLAEDGAALSKFNAADIEALLAPLDRSEGKVPSWKAKA